MEDPNTGYSLQQNAENYQKPMREYGIRNPGSQKSNWGKRLLQIQRQNSKDGLEKVMEK